MATADTLTVAGVVATPVKHTVTSEGLDVSQFRLASSSRPFDAATRSGVDGETNWFTVVAFRHVAANIAASIEKGHRILVTGRLKVRDWQTDEKKGTNVEIVADAIGHDLAFGTSLFTRRLRTPASDAGAGGSEPAEEGFPVDAQEPAALPF